MGRGVIIGAGVTLRQPARMVLGNGCCLDDLANLSARGGEETEILLGREVFIGRGAVINVRTGRIELGDCSNIGAFSRIGCSNGAVRIGKDVLVGPYTYIGAGNHRFERTDIPMSQQGQDHKGGVVIGDDVWIGGGCHVLDGVTVGRGTIIGAGSIVTRNIPEYSIAFGVPAKVYRKRVGSEQPDARPDG
jgi:acetyltransferase-like isoleucine patch superfamily enzyme